MTNFYLEIPVICTENTFHEYIRCGECFEYDREYNRHKCDKYCRNNTTTITYYTVKKEISFREASIYEIYESHETNDNLEMINFINYDILKGSTRTLIKVEDTCCLYIVSIKNINLDCDHMEDMKLTTFV